MFEKDRIERGLWWDQALNLVYGCQRVSDGCKNCWAMRESHMRKSNPNPKIQRTHEFLTDENGEWRGGVLYAEDNLLKPLRRKKPTVYAVWNDLFIDNRFGVIPHYHVIDSLMSYKQHLFIVLTKRPSIMARTLRDHYYHTQINEHIQYNPSNIFWGTTVESDTFARRLIDMKPVLDLRVLEKYKFCVSIEPMLGRIHPENFEIFLATGMLSWVIVGGESGPGSRPMDPDWAREIRDLCKKYSVPFFFKQMGGHPSKRNYFKDIPEDLRIRELPVIGETANATR